MFFTNNRISVISDQQRVISQQLVSILLTFDHAEVINRDNFSVTYRLYDSIYRRSRLRSYFLPNYLSEGISFPLKGPR